MNMPLDHGMTSSDAMSNIDITEWLDALHLASPALPIGGFAYSQGLEQAQQSGWVVDPVSATIWIRDALLLIVARQELPWWLECYRAAQEGDWVNLLAASNKLAALRETAELRLESKQMAYSLVKLFDQWLDTEKMPAPEVLIQLNENYTATHATLCALRGIQHTTALTAYLWSWLENQVLAAVKIVPLGQKDGQILMHTLKPSILQAIQIAQATPLDQAGTASFGLSIESSLHESQYSRLFRS